MEQHIIEHFKKVDPILYSYIEKVNLATHRVTTNLFSNLCDEIISQQLSGKAANTIFSRFQNLFPNETITPEELLKISDEKIRESGASWNKVKSLKDLAQKVCAKELNLEALKTMAHEEVIHELTKVRGIGPWTAEMFLMFSLGHEDIFSHGDLGLKKAIQKLYGFKKEPTRKQVEKIVAKWSPYKTYASRILWKALEL